VLPNWFLAFPVSAPWLVDLPPLPPRFRRFQPSDVHLTLLFLGGCGEAAALSALAAIRVVLATHRVSPMTVTLSHVVPMGPKREYTALSALLDQGQATVVESMKQLRDAPADAAGIRRDKRPPIPHVTLGRPQRRATEEDRAAGLAWADAVKLPQAPHTLDRVALYTWHNERRDALFRIVDAVPLAVA
jgi:RNA 2',3'-cyclic 3'-phosphodiesterase